MTNLKSQQAVGLGRVAVIAVMMVFASMIDEVHGQMAQSGHDPEQQDEHDRHYLKHLLKHAKDIGLTPEQVSKLKAVQLDAKRAEARLEAYTKVAKLELHALLEDEQVDLNAIQAKVEQLKRTEGVCLFEAIKSKRSAMALLTPDQREKDRAYREHMTCDMPHGGGMGGMSRGGMMGGSGHGQVSRDCGGRGSNGVQQHQR